VRQPLDVEVRQAERDAQGGREPPLGEILALGDLGEDSQLPQGRLIQRQLRQRRRLEVMFII
jgi:hypothetical protein